MAYTITIKEIEMDFQLVSSVVNELYAALPLPNEQAKDRAIKDRLMSLSSKYADISLENSIKYSDPITCLAYIYCYVTSHASILCHIINNSWELSSIFDSDRVNVSCIGGGPGSDLLAILKFMKLQDKSAMLRCGIYDREKMWRESLGSVCNSFEPSLSLSPYFRNLDVTKPEEYRNQQELFNADLFTMSFLISELYSRRDEADAFFEELFQRAKPGALFLILDNSYGKYHDWFDNLMSANQIEFLEADRFEFHTRCGKGDLERYYQKFYFHSPKMRAKAAYRICRKVEEW